MHIEHCKVGPDGRIVLPAPLRKTHGIHTGDTVVIESDGDSMLLRTYDSVVRETQAFFAQYKKPGVDAVDELIAERREEARRDEDETQEWLSQYRRDR